MVAKATAHPEPSGFSAGGPVQASHYPAKFSRFVVSCGPRSRSKRPFTDWRVVVVTNIRGEQPGIVALVIGDRVARSRHGHRPTQRPARPTRCHFSLPLLTNSTQALLVGSAQPV
jgi:hypothetical protein